MLVELIAGLERYYRCNNKRSFVIYVSIPARMLIGDVAEVNNPGIILDLAHL